MGAELGVYVDFLSYLDIDIDPRNSSPYTQENNTKLKFPSDQGCFIRPKQEGATGVKCFLELFEVSGVLM